MPRDFPGMTLLRSYTTADARTAVRRCRGSNQRMAALAVDRASRSPCAWLVRSAVVLVSRSLRSTVHPAMRTRGHAACSAARPRHLPADCAGCCCGSRASRSRHFGSHVLPRHRDAADDGAGVDPRRRLRDARAVRQRRRGCKTSERADRVRDLGAWSSSYFIGVLPEMPPSSTRYACRSARPRVAAEIIRARSPWWPTLIVTLWLSGLIEQRLMRATLRHQPARRARQVHARDAAYRGVLVALQAVGFDLTLLTRLRRRARRRHRARSAEAREQLHRRLHDPARPLDPDGRHDHRGQPHRHRDPRHRPLRRRASLDGVEAIVPNETLVTTTVLNHSYTDAEIRIAHAGAGGSYDSDVDLALKLHGGGRAGASRACCTDAKAAAGVARRLRRQRHRARARHLDQTTRKRASST